MHLICCLLALGHPALVGWHLWPRPVSICVHHGQPFGSVFALGFGHVLELDQSNSSCVFGSIVFIVWLPCCELGLSSEPEMSSCTQMPALHTAHVKPSSQLAHGRDSPQHWERLDVHTDAPEPLKSWQLISSTTLTAMHLNRLKTV